MATQAFYYPPNAGFPIGTADSPKSYFLELHYDNPETIEGQHVLFDLFVCLLFVV